MNEMTFARGERNEGLDAYMRQVERTPLLPPGRAEALARTYLRTRDPEIRKKLVLTNLRLVVKIAHDYGHSRQDIVDLVQEGNRGLLVAMERYDPDRNCKLTSFAAWWIRAYVVRHIMDTARLVKIGTTAAQRKLFFNLRKEQKRLEGQGTVPTDQLIAENLSVPERDVADMQLRLDHIEASLDTTIVHKNSDGYDTPVTLGDRLVDDGQPADEQAMDGEFRDLLRAKLQVFGARIQGRERDLFYERLLSNNPMRLSEFGRRYGLSRERVRQVEERLKQRIKAYLQRELGDAVRVMTVGG